MISQAVVLSGSRVKVIVHPCLAEQWEISACFNLFEIARGRRVRADECLYSDTLLSALLSCACCCRQECLWRRLIQFVNRTVMAYPWHELSALTLSEVPSPSPCRPSFVWGRIPA